MDTIQQLAVLKAKWECEIEAIEAAGRAMDTHLGIKECMAKLSVYKGCVADLTKLMEKLKTEVS